VGLPPSLSCGGSCESMFALGLSMHQRCSSYALTNLLVGLCKSVWIVDLHVNLLHPILKLQHAPSPWSIGN
jgi:hypothetical protein